MAITITATPGSATANSFCTETEAIAIAATRLNLSGWTTVSGTTCTEDEKKALIEATREVHNLEVRYQGYRTDSTQALAFPRSGVINTDAPIDAPLGVNTGYPEYADDAIPTRLKEATTELAFEFLKAGTTDIAAADTSIGVIEKTVDVLTTRWEPGMRPQGLSRYPRVMSRLAPLFKTGSDFAVSRS